MQNMQGSKQTDRCVVQVSYQLVMETDRQTDMVNMGDKHSHNDFVAGGNHNSEPIIIMAVSTDLYQYETDKQTETNRQTNKQT